MDEATSGLPEFSPQASAEGSPATSEAEAEPSLAQAEVPEGTSHPPPPTPDVEGGINPSMAEVQTSVAEDQDMNQEEEIPPVLEERVDASPASSTHVVSDSREHPETAPPSAANSGASRSLARASGVSDAELVERCQAAEVALSSPSLLPDQRAILDAALGQFRSVEAGIMEVFLSLAKGLEVCCLFFFFGLAPST